MEDKQDIKPVVTPTKGGIKAEDLSRQSSIVRLSSFRIPRDLTLGGSNAARRGGLGINAPPRGKRNFTPNLNVQRNKPKEEVKVKEEPVRREKNVPRGQSSRGRGDRGRGRNIIQQSGVFSEGMGAQDFKSSRSRLVDGGGGGDAFIVKPKVDFKATIKADYKEEEEARLKLLMRDDFIDDPDADKSRVLPLQLPISAKSSKTGKQVSNWEEARNGITTPGIKVKQEPIDEDAHINNVSHGERTSLAGATERMVDILNKKGPEFILLQLPDCLPGLRPSSEPDNPKMQAQSSSSKAASNDKIQQQQCTLSTLSDSQIGEIELLRSGAARLRIGELIFPLSVGTQASFRQDVVAVELDDAAKVGDMISLGCIRNRLISPPDWDTLLSQFPVSSSGDSLLYQMTSS